MIVKVLKLNDDGSLKESTLEQIVESEEVQNLIQVGVPPLIAAALVGANPEIAAAAAALAQSSAGLVFTQDARLPQAAPNSDYSRAWTDATNAVILGILKSGVIDAPLLRSIELAVGKINGVSNEVIASSTISGYSRVWVDSQDRILIGLRTDGTVEIPLLSTASEVAAPPPSTYKSTYQAASKKIVSGPDLALVGHSMLAGAASAFSTAFTGVSVTSLSVGGETSRTIDARVGGRPFLFKFASDTLLASGPTEITLYWDDAIVANGWPMLQSALTNLGYIVVNGVTIPGTFSLVRDPAATQYIHHAGDKYYFTPTTTLAGGNLAAPQRYPFYYSAADAVRDRIYVYWIGRNNIDATEQIIADLKAMIIRQTGLEKRFYIISEHNQSTEYATAAAGPAAAYAAVLAANTRYKNEFGRRYVESRKHFVEFGLAQAGITPTAQDLDDISKDIPPVSLRSDGLHLNTAGSTIVASLVKNRAIELGEYTP